jgi:MoaA/NifB/PqqE/SkfB family radical SAM enzyme
MNILSKSLEILKILLTRKLTIELDRVPYHFKKVPYKKILNWISVNSSFHLKTRKPFGMPVSFQIEPSNLCNLKCDLCRVTLGMKRKPENLDLNVFKKLIDEVGDYVFTIVLWDWGEPLINPDVFEMIRYAADKNIKIVCSSNGQLIRNENFARKIIESGLDSLIVAVDGITHAGWIRMKFIQWVI